MNRFIVTLAAGLVASLTLVGCSNQGGDEPEGTAIVAGQRANTAVPIPEQLIAHIPEDPAAGSVMSYFVISGEPGGQLGATLTVTGEGSSYDRQDALIEQQVTIDRMMTDETQYAQVAEADVLGAIAAAANSIANVPGDKTIVIADSMLSTAGALQFQTGLLNVSVEDASAVVADDMIPVLAGYDIVIIGFGETAAPQESLNEGQRTALQAIWEDILVNRGGAASLTLEPITQREAPLAALPDVTEVDLAVAVAPPVLSQNCNVTIPEQAIRFYPESAEFLAPTEAREVIAQAAAELEGCPGTDVLVTGTTSSWGDEQSREEVSTNRAEAVKSILETSVGEDMTVTAVGVGMNFAGYANDRDDHGNLIPSIAELNRTVTLSVS